MQDLADDVRQALDIAPQEPLDAPFADLGGVRWMPPRSPFGYAVSTV
ncbi:hypothetical protein [Streptomyces chromofuscus]|uniref:Uncharacterized protein n=1 Tax=Streptomyces chromofuscus TaxID=42881 RepID=A0A7M2T6B6_STRCW|nr:hypothetical protein [Streptomyces chromofuscus]QOV43699.1 hypothetical protein IPT68_28945 [Streptomyces chromofuscus]